MNRLKRLGLAIGFPPLEVARPQLRQNETQYRE